MYSINNFRLMDTEDSLHGGHDGVREYSIYYKGTYLGTASFTDTGSLVSCNVYAGSELYFYHAITGLSFYFKDKDFTSEDFLELLYQYKTISDYYVDVASEDSNSVLVLIRDYSKNESVLGDLTVAAFDSLEIAEEIILGKSDLELGIAQGYLKIFIVDSISDLHLHVREKERSIYE